MGRKKNTRRWEEVQALLVRMEPQICELFRRHQISPDLAAEILDEVVTLLLYRWGAVVRPEAWLVEVLEHKAWRLRTLYAAEPSAGA